MRHLVLDAWSRRSSFLHQRDPRAKLIVLGAFLVAVGTARPLTPAAAAGYLLLLLVGMAASGLPFLPVLLRAGVVLPFAFTFAAVTALAGQREAAVALVARSYLSGLAAVLVIATTPMPRLLRALEWFRLPRMILLVVQFLYRYLFVMVEQAQRMRQAAGCRGGLGVGFFGRGSLRRSRARAAAGALAVLFGSSLGRAEGIHRAMLARGFQGRLPALAIERPAWSDGAFLLAAAAIPVALRIAG